MPHLQHMHAVFKLLVLCSIHTRFAELEAADDCEKLDHCLRLKASKPANSCLQGRGCWLCPRAIKVVYDVRCPSKQYSNQALSGHYHRIAWQVAHYSAAKMEVSKSMHTFDNV